MESDSRYAAETQGGLEEGDVGDASHVERTRAQKRALLLSSLSQLLSSPPTNKFDDGTYLRNPLNDDFPPGS
jgi:hypothetical protein